MGNWDPRQVSFSALFDAQELKLDSSKPYPFFLAHPLETDPQELGDISDWQAEWKWDGIRGQLIRRNGETFLWSRGEELVNDKFPELLELAESLPNGTVIDGEIMAFRDGEPLPFSLLQTRIGRKNLSKKQLQEAPVSLLAYDLLEFEGNDIRHLPIQQRRSHLERLHQAFPHERLQLPHLIQAASWEELRQIRSLSREHLAEA